MSTSPAERAARARDVRLTEHQLIVELTDGRTITFPLAWYPRLLAATADQRQAWELLGGGEGLRWPAIDEDLSVAGLLQGVPDPHSGR